MDEGEYHRVPPLTETSENLGRPRLLTLNELHSRFKKTPKVIAMLKYLEDKSAVLPGTKNFRVLKEATKKAAYPVYLRYCQKEELPSFHRTEFYHYLHLFGVHPSQWTKFLCDKCTMFKAWENVRKSESDRPPPDLEIALH